MKEQKFVDVFDVKLESENVEIIDDYEMFHDKELLEELRNKIIQNLIDHNIETRSMNDFVK